MNEYFICCDCDVKIRSMDLYLMFLDPPPTKTGMRLTNTGQCFRCGRHLSKSIFGYVFNSYNHIPLIGYE